MPRLAEIRSELVEMISFTWRVFKFDEWYLQEIRNLVETWKSVALSNGLTPTIKQA